MENVSQLSLKSLSGAIVKRWRPALFVSLLIFAGLASYVFSLSPAYTSSAVVMLAPAAEELHAEPGDHSAAMTDPFFIRSETDILSSEQLTRTVIDRLQLWKLPEFQPHEGLRARLGLKEPAKAPGVLTDREMLMDHVARDYASRLTVFNDGRSKTVEIGFTASNPRTAASIANAHAEAYLREQSTRRLGTQDKAIEWLAKEVDARAAEVRQADANVQQYQLKHGIVSANDVTMVEQRLALLSTQLMEARRRLSTQVSMLSEIRDIRAGGDPGNASAMLADEPLKALLQNRVQAESNLASLEKRLAPTHPALLKQRQELASLNKVLDSQLHRLESETESGVSLWQRQVNDLNSAVNNETSNKQNQDKVAASLPAIIAEAHVKRSVFETVLNRYQTLLAERGFLAPAASIVSRAVPSGQPSFPRTPLFLAIAAIASLFGGAAVAILLQLRKPPSMDLTAIADELGVRPLVSIPRFRNASRQSGVIHIEDPRLYIESIRFLRDAILESRKDRECIICLVTSALPRQGKSLVAMSLSRALARADNSTLLIEADLRQPTGSALARRPLPEKGIAALLQGRATFAEAVARDESTGLDMLLAEKDASQALDRLTAGTFRELLSRLRQKYDAIIIDSPPVGIVSDALAIAPLADQTIIVAKDGDAPVEELKRTTRLLRDRGNTVAGLVLTSIDPDEMSAVDRKTLNRYVMGVPSVTPGPIPARRPPRSIKQSG